MSEMSEIDNAECREALALAETRPSMFDVPLPIEMGALLWHDLIEIHGGIIRLTAKGEFRLARQKEHAGLHDADPNCVGSVQPARGGGIKCTKCPGWFRF